MDLAGVEGCPNPLYPAYLTGAIIDSPELGPCHVLRGSVRQNHDALRTATQNIRRQQLPEVAHQRSKSAQRVYSKERSAVVCFASADDQDGATWLYGYPHWKSQQPVDHPAKVTEAGAKAVLGVDPIQCATRSSSAFYRPPGCFPTLPQRCQWGAILIPRLRDPRSH